jgi:kumamolisin
MKKDILKEDLLVPLAGSHRETPVATQVGAVDANEVINVTIRLRRKKAVEHDIEKGHRFTHDEYEKQFGASEEDIALVKKFAHENHFTIAEISPARRTVILAGRTRDFESAFQVILNNYKDAAGNTFRGRSGQIYIPGHLEGVVEGVFGLDNRPVARPMFKIYKQDGRVVPHATTFAGYSPNVVGEAYGFPQGVTGEGECIGIIELGGGYRTVDLNNYFKSCILLKYQQFL